jgi:hypothetical protein
MPSSSIPELSSSAATANNGAKGLPLQAAARIAWPNSAGHAAMTAAIFGYIFWLMACDPQQSATQGTAGDELVGAGIPVFLSKGNDNIS